MDPHQVNSEATHSYIESPNRPTAYTENLWTSPKFGFSSFYERKSSSVGNPFVDAPKTPSRLVQTNKRREIWETNTNDVLNNRLRECRSLPPKDQTSEIELDTAFLSSENEFALLHPNHLPFVSARSVPGSKNDSINLISQDSSWRGDSFDVLGSEQPSQVSLVTQSYEQTPSQGNNSVQGYNSVPGYNSAQCYQVIEPYQSIHSIEPYQSIESYRPTQSIHPIQSFHSIDSFHQIQLFLDGKTTLSHTDQLEPKATFMVKLSYTKKSEKPLKRFTVTNASRVISKAPTDMDYASISLPSNPNTDSTAANKPKTGRGQYDRTKYGKGKTKKKPQGRPPKSNAKLPVAVTTSSSQIQRTSRNSSMVPLKSLFEDDEEYKPNSKKKVHKVRSQEEIDKEKKRRIGPRSKSGCWTCRVRHKSCPEDKDVCRQCRRLKLACDYSEERPLYMTDPVLQAIKLKQIRIITNQHKKIYFMKRTEMAKGRRG